jgi:GrpB-like predicted nucleotidyltransferase (UPF0157 family)
MKYFTPYNDVWPHRSQQIARFLYDQIPNNCRIHHVGSTAIPGIPAKDIIDLDIEYPSGTMQSIIGILDEAGYVHEGDKGIPSRETFCPKMGSSASKLPQHHLYACESQSPELFKHLAFREYLILHVQRAKWLAAQKIATGKLPRAAPRILKTSLRLMLSSPGNHYLGLTKSWCGGRQMVLVDGVELEQNNQKLSKTTNRTRTTFAKKKAYFPNSNGKSFNFSLESKRIIDKNRPISLSGSCCDPGRTRNNSLRF